MSEASHEKDTSIISSLEKNIIEALEKRRGYIWENLENVTLKTLRRLLEEDLGLEKDGLRPHKAVLSSHIDKILLELEEQKKAKGSKKKSDNIQQEKEKTSHQGKSYTKRFVRMREMCKRASITIPPNLYRDTEDDEDLEKRILMLMEKNGLNEHSRPADIQQCKEKLQLQRDMDGIDANNIIEGGRRRKTTRVLKELVEHSPSEDSDEENTSNNSVDSTSGKDLLSGEDLSSGEDSSYVQEGTQQKDANRVKNARDWSDDD